MYLLNEALFKSINGHIQFCSTFILTVRYHRHIVSLVDISLLLLFCCAFFVFIIKCWNTKSYLTRNIEIFSLRKTDKWQYTPMRKARIFAQLIVNSCYAVEKKKNVYRIRYVVSICLVTWSTSNTSFMLIYNFFVVPCVFVPRFRHFYCCCCCYYCLIRTFILSDSSTTAFKNP